MCITDCFNTIKKTPSNQINDFKEVFPLINPMSITIYLIQKLLFHKLYSKNQIYRIKDENLKNQSYV